MSIEMFEHVERMNEYRMPRMVLMVDLSGVHVWSRYRFGLKVV